MKRLPALCLGIALALAGLCAHAAFAFDWETGQGFRSAPLPDMAPGKPGFTLLTPAQTGITFSNQLSEAKAAENQIRLNGSGVALGDVDGDGWCDIYLCRLEGPNALYRNKGNWQFEDITAAAGVGCEDQYSTGAVLVDVDGDGDLDLLVNGIGTGTRLFLNDGRGKFTESTNAGLLRKFGATSLALADIDGDGTLDLYVADYRTTTIRSTGFSSLRMGNKRMPLPQDRDRIEFTPDGRVLEHGEPDVLYRNDGHGNFAPVSWTDGVFLDESGQALAKPPLDWGLTAAFHDLNGDGAPDLYVCNDFHSTDKIWINDRHGHFRAIAPLAIRHTSTFSMTLDIGDLDRDGLDDIFVADMLRLSHAARLMQFALTDPYFPQPGVYADRPQVDRNTLQLNRGDGTYSEVAFYAGLESSDWTWAAALLDVDLDGYLDVLCSTGQMFDTQDVDAEARIQAKGPWRRELIPQKLLMFPHLPQAKVAFHNRGDLTFELSGPAWGFDQLEIGHGIALADLDNDGDLDVVVNNLNAPAGIYRNNSAAPRMAVRLKGLPPNTRGVGARISVTGGPVAQATEMSAGGRYLSGDDTVRVFAAGATTNDLRIEVSWRAGGRSVVEHARANRIYEIEERAGTQGSKEPSIQASKDPSAQVAEPPRKSPVTTDHGQRTTDTPPAAHWFQDVSALLGHTHHQESFDDFARQPLLPKKLSQLGPGVAWFDLDNDGWDDLVIGTGKGGALAVYRNDGHGGFKPSDQTTPFQQRATRDQGAVLGINTKAGAAVVLAGSFNYQDGLALGGSVRQYRIGAAQVEDAIPGQLSSTGPLALGDMNGDGELDLFVGGRCLPGRWPEPATSLLFLRKGDHWEVDQANAALLGGIGLVSGAVFTDVNGDGAPDLVLACEWGPLRVLINHAGRLSDETSRWGLAGFNGWWNGIAAGDFDGDGRMDLVASNWGLNSSYQNPRECRASLPLAGKGPLSPTGTLGSLLYYGDFDGNGTVDPIEARYDQSLRKTVPTRSRSAIALGLPVVGDRFKTFSSFDEASVQDVLGDAFPKARVLEAGWLASTVFLNRGDHFEPVLLPAEAQFAPAFGIAVADFDGDGNEDIFLSQNFFELESTMARLDGGRAVLLRGSGAGTFTSIPAQTSGLAVYGEGRGAAVADYDGDGRADLVTTQNGAETKLYRNVAAAAGVRVRLKGGVGNPAGIGAVVRLGSRQRWGPAREIHAGSGYWSQDSAVQVMAAPGAPDAIEVRWPWGEKVVRPLPPGAKEVNVDANGVTLVR